MTDQEIIASILYNHFKSWTDQRMVFHFLTEDINEPPINLPDGVHRFSHDLNIIAQAIVDALAHRRSIGNLLKPPSDWPLLPSENGWGEDLMSNFGHTINEPIAQQLRSEQVLAKYPGQNFNATCWFANGQYHAAIYRYHEHEATISADTPKTLMQLVSEQYGWE